MVKNIACLYISKYPELLRIFDVYKLTVLLEYLYIKELLLSVNRVLMLIY
jgi:hypothetical protein